MVKQSTKSHPSSGRSNVRTRKAVKKTTIAKEPSKNAHARTKQQPKARKASSKRTSRKASRRKRVPRFGKKHSNATTPSTNPSAKTTTLGSAAKPLHHAIAPRDKTTDAPLKRKRGRPRKHPIPAAAKPAPSDIDQLLLEGHNASEKQPSINLQTEGEHQHAKQVSSKFRSPTQQSVEQMLSLSSSPQTLPSEDSGHKELQAEWQRMATDLTPTPDFRNARPSIQTVRRSASYRTMLERKLFWLRFRNWNEFTAKLAQNPKKHVDAWILLASTWQSNFDEKAKPLRTLSAIFEQNAQLPSDDDLVEEEPPLLSSSPTTTHASQRNALSPLRQQPRSPSPKFYHLSRPRFKPSRERCSPTPPLLTAPRSPSRSPQAKQISFHRGFRNAKGALIELSKANDLESARNKVLRTYNKNFGDTLPKWKPTGQDLMYAQYGFLNPRDQHINSYWESEADEDETIVPPELERPFKMNVETKTKVYFRIPLERFVCRDLNMSGLPVPQPPGFKSATAWLKKIAKPEAAFQYLEQYTMLYLLNDLLECNKVMQKLNLIAAQEVFTLLDDADEEDETKIVKVLKTSKRLLDHCWRRAHLLLSNVATASNDKLDASAKRQARAAAETDFMKHVWDYPTHKDDLTDTCTHDLPKTFHVTGKPLQRRLWEQAFRKQTKPSYTRNFKRPKPKPTAPATPTKKAPVFGNKNGRGTKRALPKESSTPKFGERARKGSKRKKRKLKQGGTGRGQNQNSQKTAPKGMPAPK